MELKTYLAQELSLSPEYILALDRLFTGRECVKNQQLLSEGTRSQQVIYVEKGLLRLYFSQDGRDVTHEFLMENSFYLPIEVVFLHTDFPYRLEAIEATEIRTADYASIKQYVTNDAKLQAFVHYLMTSAIKMLSDRIYAIQFQCARDRYRDLLENRSEILQRVPLGQIASYLGITPQTLSVIRRAEAHNK